MGAQLPVPYVTQLDPATGLGGSNCGPACLSMALAWRGVIAPTYGAMIYVADIVRDGIPDGRGLTGAYTTFAQLIDCAGWFDQPMRWIGDWSAIYASLDAGEPVVLLVDNVELDPRQYPRTAAFNAHHFVLLTGYDDSAGTFTANDPLSIVARGPAPYGMASVSRAANAVGGVQAVALIPIDQEQDMSGILDELNAQIAALRQEIADRDTTIGSLRNDVEAPLRQEVAGLTKAKAVLEAKVAELEAAGAAPAPRPAGVRAARLVLDLDDEKSLSLPLGTFVLR